MAGVTRAFDLVGRIMIEGGDSASGDLRTIGNAAESTGTKFSLAGAMMHAAGNLISTAIQGVGGVMKSAIGIGIEYNKNQEQSEVAWTTLLGTQEKAKQMLKDLSNLAKKTQFDTATVDAMAKYMHNAGLEGKALTDQIVKVADVSGAFNISADNAQELAKQMSQVQQSGVAMGEDLNIMGDRGIPILKELANVMGVNVDQVKDLASKGKVTSEIYMKAFDNIANSVKGSADKQAQTFGGMISTMQDNLGILAGALTKSLFESMKGFMDWFVKLLDTINAGFAAGGLRGALEAIFPKSFVDRLATIKNTIELIFGILAKGDFKGGLGFEEDSKFVDFLFDVRDGFKWLIDNWQLVVAGLAGIYSGIAAFKILTTVVKAWKAFNAALVIFRTQGIAATLATWGLNTALLANPILWIAIGIGVLIAAIVLLIMKWDYVRTFLLKLWDDIKGAFVTAWTAIKDWFIALWDSIVSLFSKYGMIILGVLAPFLLLPMLIFQYWDVIKGFFTQLWTDITSAIMTAWNAIVAWITPVLNGIKTTFEVIFFALFYIVYKVLEMIWNIISPFVMPIVNFIVEKFTWLKDQAAIIWDWISTKIQEVLLYIQAKAMEIISAVVTFIVEKWAWIQTETKRIWDLITTAIQTALNWVKNTVITPIVEGIKTVVSAAFNWLHDKAVKPAMDKVQTTTTSAWDTIKGIFSRGVQAVKDAAQWVWDTVFKPWVDQAVLGFKRIFEVGINLFQSGKDIMNGLLNGLTAGWTAVKKGITDLADKGKKLWSELWGSHSPSTFTQYIGRMLGDGMSIGIENSTGGVVDSAKQMATSTLSALNKPFSPSVNMGGASLAAAGLGAAGGGGGSYTVEIPVMLNGREIARAVAPDIDQELERNRKVTARARGTV